MLQMRGEFQSSQVFKPSLTFGSFSKFFDVVKMVIIHKKI